MLLNSFTKCFESLLCYLKVIQKCNKYKRNDRWWEHCRTAWAGLWWTKITVTREGRSRPTLETPRAVMSLPDCKFVYKVLQTWLIIKLFQPIKLNTFSLNLNLLICVWILISTTYLFFSDLNYNWRVLKGKILIC